MYGELGRNLTAGKIRLPTPSRLAHDFVNQVRRAVAAGEPIPE